MSKCHYCQNALIREYDEVGTPTNFWEDREENIYCDHCFWILYTVPEEKALENYNHDNKKVREKSRAKLIQLEKFWGSL